MISSEDKKDEMIMTLEPSPHMKSKPSTSCAQLNNDSVGSGAKVDSNGSTTPLHQPNKPLSPSIPSTRSDSSLGSMDLMCSDMDKLSVRSCLKDDIDLVHLTEHVGQIPKTLLKNRKTLEEESKVLSLDWCFDSRFLVTSLQSGHLCVWDTFTKERVNMIETSCTWVFASAFSPSGNYIAAGGLDSKCAVYKLPRVNQPLEVQHVAQHQSYVLSCVFTLSDHQILTASSDHTCGLWDVESSHLIKEFKGHSSDVTSIDFKKFTGNTFVTGSADRQVGLWDMRTGTCVQSFNTHTEEINQVRFFPSGEAIASVSDDMTCRFYDLRMDAQLAVFKRNGVLFPACSLDFSLNGRLLFVGYGDHSFHVWDTLRISHCGSMYSHENKVNVLSLSPDGCCVCTGSWDQTVKLWY